VVEEVTGGEGPMAGVEGVVLRNVKTGETSRLGITGLFIAIGHDPATGIFKDKLDLDAEGYIEVAANSTKTSQPGIFAAGDCVDKVFRQAITAAGMGCMAALEAEKYLAALNDSREQAAE